MANKTWTAGKPSFDTRWFRDEKTEHRHVVDHFLPKGEQWEDLYDGPTPGTFRSKRASLEAKGAGTSEHDAVLAEAHTYYMAAILAVWGEKQVIEQKNYLYQYKQFPLYEAIGIISRKGVLLGFSEGRVSELKTAFRPRQGLRGRLTERQFVRAAKTRLSVLLAKSDLLRRHDG